jgi:hypothetical protein
MKKLILILTLFSSCSVLKPNAGSCPTNDSKFFQKYESAKNMTKTKFTKTKNFN